MHPTMAYSKKNAQGCTEQPWTFNMWHMYTLRFAEVVKDGTHLQRCVDALTMAHAESAQFLTEWFAVENPAM